VSTLGRKLNRILLPCRVMWPDLTPTQFRHPIDTKSTQALQRVFPLEFMIRQGSSGVVEQFMFLDNMSSGVRVGPNQLPKIYAALQEAKQVLGLDIPVDLYVKQNPVPNAYTMAMQVGCKCSTTQSGNCIGCWATCERGRERQREKGRWRARARARTHTHTHSTYVHTLPSDILYVYVCLCRERNHSSLSTVRSSS
jgi:hypothetical protein